MNMRMIREALEASVIEGEDQMELPVEHVYASDLMSDVLAFGKPHSVLLTGLATQQSVISAHMAEFRGVVFLRGKKSTDGARRFARDHRLVLLSTGFDTYDACVRIEAIREGNPAGLAAGADPRPDAELSLSRDFFIMGGDYANAGSVSTEVKSILKKIGLDPRLIRRIAISTYEGEMNVVMHARQAKARLTVTPAMVQVTIEDQGPGIPDVELAMQEGFTTATEEMRAMGFGSGMGLPNIKKNADEMRIDSRVGEGTSLEMKFRI